MHHGFGTIGQLLLHVSTNATIALEMLFKDKERALEDRLRSGLPPVVWLRLGFEPFDDALEDWTKELEAAITDRWVEWKANRNA